MSSGRIFCRAITAVANCHQPCSTLLINRAARLSGVDGNTIRMRLGARTLRHNSWLVALPDNWFRLGFTLPVTAFIEQCR